VTKKTSQALLEVREQDRVVHLWVPKPARAGEPASRLARDLVQACQAIDEQETPPVGVALGSGGESFVLHQPGSADELDALSPAWAESVQAVARLGPPTVAVIGSAAIGPSWELALACDLRVAALEAKVGSPEVRLGRLPVAGGAQRLARLAGEATALRLLLLGEILEASAALDLGLLHRVAPRAELERCMDELLDELRAGAPIALAYAKEAVQRAADLPLADGLRLEADLSALLQTTQDRAEGLEAFRNHRPPRFEGR
jgi:enoyl-CoA hydratase/carnithine racemase